MNVRGRVQQDHVCWSSSGGSGGGCWSSSCCDGFGLVAALEETRRGGTSIGGNERRDGKEVEGLI